MLTVYDWSNIEGRLTAWTCGEQWKVDAFRAFDDGSGHDLYKLAYATSFNLPVEDVTKDERQVGKVQELALGFAGGRGAFASMAAIYGVKLPDDEIERVVDGWRDAHPMTVIAWNALEATAKTAIRNPGKTFAVVDYLLNEGEKPACLGIVYMFDGKHLWCKIPSGERLCYPFATIKDVEKPWGVSKSITYWGLDTTQRWVEKAAWRGILIENIVQALAREILVHSLLKLEHYGYRVVMHVHDEIVCEGSHIKAEMVEKIMTTLPEWAKDNSPCGPLPLAAAGWQGERYKKD